MKGPKLETLPLPGMQDLLPSETHAWQFLERAFWNHASLYGYREIRTPILERIEIIDRTSGETSDIVTKEMFDFVDKGERTVVMRPELTAPAMRAVVEYNLCPPSTLLRLAYGGPFFRYGAIQKGRFRQAHQFGIELIGGVGPEADAEVIEFTVRFYEKLGLDNLVVLLNSIGRAECRSKYETVILDHLAPWLKDQETEVQDRARRNPLRTLDWKEESIQPLLKTMPPLTDYLEDASKARLDSIQQFLGEVGVAYRLDPSLVRGLDYYTETVFEIQSRHLGAQGSLCGGGRYDNLLAELGGLPTPSVGVGIGIERALIALEAEGFSPVAPRPDVFVISAGKDARDTVRLLTSDLRRAGVRALSDVDGKSLRSQMRQADGSGATFAIILGSDELTTGQYQVRALREQETFTVPAGEVVEWIFARR